MATTYMIHRLNSIRFPLVFGVLLIHSYTIAFADMGYTAGFARVFISNGLASVSVPMFFFIAGYLFFHKLQWSLPVYIKKLKHRIYSLLIPYLLWNIIALCYMVIIFGNPNPNTSHFWFLEYLMVMSVLTPVVHLMHRKWSMLWVLVLFVVWLFHMVTWPMPALFFYAGSLIAYKKWDLFQLDKYGFLFAVLAVALFALAASLYMQVDIVYKIAIVLFIPAVLWLSKFLTNKVFLWLGSASFFVFCFHQPILGQLIGRVRVWLQLQGDVELLGLYFGSAIITGVVGLALFWFSKKYLPTLTKVLTGLRV